MRLFPRFENVGYSEGFVQMWEDRRRVCTDKHFDTYFRMGIGDEALPASEIDEVIERAGDAEYVKQAFRKALGLIRKNGKSKVPLLLDELNVHAARIEKAKFQPLISAIFHVADDINRDEDREGGGFFIGTIYANPLAYSKVDIRKVRSKKKGVDIFLAACQKAQVGWLDRFHKLSRRQTYFPREGKRTTNHARNVWSARNTSPSLKELAIKDH